MTGYLVTATPGGRTCAATAATTCTVTGLTNGTGYALTVTATTIGGISEASVASAGITPRTAPSAPTGVAATRGDGSAIVTWTAPVSTGGAVVTAYIATASPGGRTCDWSGGAFTCTITGLDNGIAHSIGVVAVNAVGPGPSAIAPNAVTPSTVPGAPTGASAIAGIGTATVSWSAPALDGGSTISGYTVLASPGAATCTTTGALSCTITGLTAGEAYTFTVRAGNAAGTGAASAATSAVVVRAAPAPQPGRPPTGAALGAASAAGGAAGPIPPVGTVGTIIWSPKAVVGKPLTATFTPAPRTTYVITAKVRGRTVKGKCVGGVCTLPIKKRGKYVVKITPMVGKKAGKPVRKVIRIKKPAKPRAGFPLAARGLPQRHG